MGKTKTEAETMNEIAYAAFQTHYKVTKQQGWSEPEDHWRNNPQARTLWHGLVKMLITNIANAQTAGLLPSLIIADVRTPLLSGLGGSPLGGNTGPHEIARRIQERIHTRIEASRSPPVTAEDVAQKLALESRTDKQAGKDPQGYPPPGTPWGAGPQAAPGQSVLDSSNRDVPPGLAIGRCTEPPYDADKPRYGEFSENDIVNSEKDSPE